MSAARAPSGGSVANTALCDCWISGYPRLLDWTTMSACSARPAFVARAISGTKSGRTGSLDIRKVTFQYLTGNLTLSGAAMNGHPIRESVAQLFARTGRGTRVAVEQELFAMDLLSGHSVAPDRVRAAIAGRDYSRWVTFEPGGQVELSLPPAENSTAATAQLTNVTDALAADLIGRGIALAAGPARDQDPNTPRYLASPRYDAMEAHFDSIGPAGRRMMRSTASTQVC